MSNPPKFSFLDQGQEFIFSNRLGSFCLPPPWLNGPCINIQEPSAASHLKAGALFSNSTVEVHDSQAQKYRNDKGAYQFHLWSKRFVISPNWLQLCKSRSGLCNPKENQF